MENLPIATIEKSKLEELRVALTEYKGRRYVDVRTYCDPYPASRTNMAINRRRRLAKRSTNRL